MAGPLAFTEADIRLAAGVRSFERGRDYIHHVADLEIAASEITASVRGGEEYRVCLRPDQRELRGDCTCPYGREGFFCKHCVAVGLAVLEMEKELPQLLEEARAEWRTLESWLGTLSREELLAELLGLLDDDRELRRRMELRAASLNADAAKVRRVVRELITAAHREYLDYKYANDVYQAAAAIDELAEGGAPADAIEIAREAIALLAEVVTSVEGSAEAFDDAARELLAAHLRACQAAPPDPVSLGGYLAGLLLDGEHGIWPDLGDYADLLGDRGAAAIRERIAAAYAQNPKNWRARSLMESVATAEGDVDALVAVYAADLDDRGGNHLRIAQALDAAGRGAEALGWAERGLREATHPDHGLVEYLAGRYAAAGRDQDVLHLRRDRFDAERTLASYRALREAAAASGSWPGERSRALATLREDARATRRQGLWAWNGPVLVDALTDDGDLDAAWEAAADGATEEQWLRLADAAAATRPADALGVYLKAIGSLKTQTGEAAYRRMATLLLAARACHEALGSPEVFRRYLAALRAECKRKRNLMKILDENGL